MSGTSLELRRELRILMVANELADTRFITRVLVENGNHVGHTNTERLFDHIACLQPDIIVFDLPEENQSVTAMCRAIRGDYRDDQLAILVAVNLSEEAHLRDVVDAGATDFLMRGSHTLLIEQRLRLLLRQHEKGLALQKHQQRQRHAHKVARIGHWDYDLQTGEMFWSDEIFELLNLPRDKYPNNFEAFRASTYEDDFIRLQQMTLSAMKYGAPYSSEHRVKRNDGKEQYVALNGEFERDADDRVVRVHGIMQDITERYLNQEKIQHQAYHDALTGLPNRLLFHDRLEHAMRLRGRTSGKVAILFIDLDRFKPINDSLGHKVGDGYLQAIANNLSHCVRRSDTLARLGGDEFAVIIEDAVSEANVSQIAQKLIDAIARPVKVEEHDLFGAGSIGIALSHDDYGDRETLIRQADIAMYQAKELGGNQFCVYNDNMQMRVTDALSMERELRDAIDKEQLIVHYQPKVCVRSGRIKGMEALIRWEHPERGMIPPIDFIPLAEKTGLILPIGKWVLREACKQTVAWHRAGFDGLMISVNVSIRQFNDKHFYDDVVRTIEDSGIDPRSVDLEITESCTITNIERTIGILERLRQMGVKISLDDFGTGFSSLSFLHQLPLDALKVDRSFIRDIQSTGRNGELAKLIIGIASSLELNVVAEGVETETHLDFLRHNGCNEYQGYFLSPPVDADAFLNLLKQNRPNSPSLQLISNG